MNCQKCMAATRVARTTTVVIGKAEVRVRELECDCGMHYQTQERLVKSYMLPARCRQATGTLPARRDIVLSDSDPELFPDLSDQNPDQTSETLLRVDQTGVMAKKGRGDAADYPPEFEELWEGCKGKKGNKLPAFKAWKKNKPPLTLTKERWALWMTTASWADGFSQHMATWLNERGWENVPEPIQFKRRVNGRLETVPAARPSGPPVAIAEQMALRAKELEKRAEISRQAEAELFRQQFDEAKGHG